MADKDYFKKYQSRINSKKSKSNRQDLENVCHEMLFVYIVGNKRIQKVK